MRINIEVHVGLPILNCQITYKHALSVLPSKPLQTKLVHIYGLSKKWDQ